MSRAKVFVSAILAGACIAFGGTVFLSLDSKVLGAMLFTVGLFCVCTFGLHLFTGKVCYVFEKDKTYALDLVVVWLGNFVGVWVIAQLMRLTRVGVTLGEKAVGLCQIKLDDSVWSIFILAVFCNIFIYIGVESFNKNPHEIGKYLGLFFSIMVFILCGFEHCVANMYYFSIAGVWSGKTLLYLLVMTLGNAVGGVVFPLLRRYIQQ